MSLDDGKHVTTTGIVTGTITGLNIVTGSVNVSGVQKMDAQGETDGTQWDDGFDHDGVTKIYVRCSVIGIESVKFDYVKDGQPQQGAIHGEDTCNGETVEIVINHPDEYLVSVSGWYQASSDPIILGLIFITNQKIHEYTGLTPSYTVDDVCTEFTFQVQDKKIIGFYGIADYYLTSIGAYFVPLGTGTNYFFPGFDSSYSGAQKLDAQGGTDENPWNDGPEHDAVTKIYVRASQRGIEFVKFDYVKRGERQYGVIHGEETSDGETIEIVINHPHEYLVSVSGWYDPSDPIIMGLQFTTNQKVHRYSGWEPGQSYSVHGCTEFTLKVEDKKIAGFHGFAGHFLTSIGAYFVPLGSENTYFVPGSDPDVNSDVQKLDLEGSPNGSYWDDGFNHDGVKKIYVRYTTDGIEFLKIHYMKDGKTQQGSINGKETGKGTQVEITFNHPDEYLISVDGWYSYSSTNIGGLQLKTNKKTYDYIGNAPNSSVDGYTEFTLQAQDKKIIGFYGYADPTLSSIGAYLGPLNWLASHDGPQKLEAQGGANGTHWNDGSDHNGVTKIYIRCSQRGIEFVKFDYVKGGEKQHGDIHGEETSEGKTVEIVINHPWEYLVSVSGWYDITDPVIMGLKFTTNQKVYEYTGFTPSYSVDGCTEFTLQVQDKKIVGFHGFADQLLRSIGAYFGPLRGVTNYFVPGSDSGVQRLDEQGSSKGNYWDDGSDHDGVKKIYTRYTTEGIEYLKIHYMKGGKTQQGAINGKETGKGKQVEITIKHPDEEYIVSVDGWYSSSSTNIAGLQFKTNKKTYDYIGLTPDSSVDGYTEFTLEALDKKIIGFYGYASDLLYSIGAYVVPVSFTTTPTDPPKLETHGGETEAVLDDGAREVLPITN